MLPDAILDKLILPSELVRTLIVALTNGMYMPKGYEVLGYVILMKTRRKALPLRAR